MWALEVAHIFQALRLNFLKNFSLFAKFAADIMINSVLIYVINMLTLQSEMHVFME
jgi:hypothetical protein